LQQWWERFFRAAFQKHRKHAFFGDLRANQPLPDDVPASGEDPARIER
jgi:hypothetical protein